MSSLAADMIHSTAVKIACAADVAFDYLSDANRLQTWALTQCDVTAQGHGLVSARSRLNDSIMWVAIDADAKRCTVDYQVGPIRDTLAPIIMARVIPGADLGESKELCIVSMFAWRSAAMDDARWRRLIASHEWEIVLLQSLIESQARSS